MSDSRLKDELYHLFATDLKIFEFLENGCLDGIWYWDMEKPEEEWYSDRFWTFLGYDPSEKKPLSKEWQDIIYQEDLEVAIANFNAHCQDPNHPYDQVVRYHHKDGHTIWVRCRGLAIRDENGVPIRMLGAHTDITELKELEQELKDMAITDHLTGLPNRRGFVDHFNWAVCHSCRNKQPISIALVDIDHFKSVNDSFGHDQGDKTLIDVATVLNTSTRKIDFVSRWGGEEFVVLMHETDSIEAFQVCDRIRNQISNSVCIGRQNITVSMGVCTWTPTAGKGCSACDILDTFVQRADKALYKAKKTGRNKVVSTIL